MKLLKIISLAAILWSGIQLSDAQQLPVYSNYFLNPFYYNPARAGTDLDGGRINLGFQKQWDKIPEGPISTYGSWDGRIKSSNMALGATIYHDRTTASWQNTGGSLAYAYHIPFNKERTHFLSIGLQAGVSSLHIHDFTPADPNDPAIANARNVNFDLSLGINYHWKGLNIGFSVPQVLGNKVKFKSSDPAFANNTTIQRQYVVIAQYEAKLGKKKAWSLQPNLMVNYVKKSLPVFLDITLMAAYKHIAWLAFGYANGGGFKPNGDAKGFFLPNAAGIHATAGVSIKELVDISYTFKSTVGKKGNLVASNLGFTHEVLLSFRLKRKTDQSEFEKNKKRTDDDIAKVNTKADAASSKADDAMNKVDSLGEAVNRLGDAVDKSVSDIKSITDKSSTDIEKSTSSLDNIIYKKFGSVYFEVDKYELSDEAKASIDALKSKLSQMKGNYFIYLAGSASTEGSTSYNQALSTKRCDAVKKYIEGIGIAQHVLLLPYGENAPVTEKQTQEIDRAKNRRVDIYLSGE